MKFRHAAAAVLLALPLSGCIFAVGAGGDGEALRDKVRDLEMRVDKLESRPNAGMPFVMTSGQDGSVKVESVEIIHEVEK